MVRISNGSSHFIKLQLHYNTETAQIINCVFSGEQLSCNGCWTCVLRSINWELAIVFTCESSDGKILKPKPVSYFIVRTIDILYSDLCSSFSDLPQIISTFWWGSKKMFYFNSQIYSVVRNSNKLFNYFRIPEPC